MVGPQLQSSLGRITPSSIKKDRSWNNGYFMIGEVIKVHHKRYTADVKIYGNTNIIISSDSNEGKYSCRICVGNAGYDETFKKPYGEIIPIQEGAIVLVAFVKNNEKKPVIVGILHDNSEAMNLTNSKNILTSSASVDDESDKYRYTNITRSQDFFTINGVGEFQLSSHTKSFIVAKNAATFNGAEFFGYDNLEIKDSGKSVISIDEKYSTPLKYLAVFFKNFDTTVKDALRFVIDPLKQVFRVAQVNDSEEKLSTVVIDEDGTMLVRRQQDSSSWSGDSEKYTELSLKEDGSIGVELVDTEEVTSTNITNKETNINIESKVENSSVNINATSSKVELKVETNNEATVIKITSAGVELQTKQSLGISSESYINLNGKDVNIDGSNVALTGNVTVNGKQIECKCE